MDQVAVSVIHGPHWSLDAVGLFLRLDSISGFEVRAGAGLSDVLVESDNWDWGGGRATKSSIAKHGGRLLAVLGRGSCGEKT